MKEHIVNVLKRIELDYDIKVLYACESGSRAWGFPSKDSDYDVRFIYIHKKNWYLSIDEKRDVIEIISRDSLSMSVDQLLDISGWELTKALRLFRKSNPSLLEWLHSSIVYYQSSSTIDKMRTLEDQIFSPSTCLNHYVKMAKGNFRDYLRSTVVTVKKYLKFLRPILAAKWIEKYHTAPPIEFSFLLESIVPSGELKEAIDTIFKRKIAGEELKQEPRVEVINQFLQREIEHLELYIKEINNDIQDPTEQLNRIFRETLEEAWKE